MKQGEFVSRLTREWETSPRWSGIRRPYTAEDVWRLRGSVEVEHTLARMGAARLWELLQEGDYLPALSAMNGNQAIQHVKAGLRAIYVSGWQAAADANNAHQMYPDLSLYPSNSVPTLVRHINNALLRADQIHHRAGDDGTRWLVPLVADAEAGFGGPLHAFEIMKAMIEEGAAGVHFEDQLASVKKCGHLGGKVLVPTREFVAKLIAARLAADVSGIDTLLFARTDADSATLITSNVDTYDQRFIDGQRTHEGFFRTCGGTEVAIARSLAYAPHADVLWFETSRPDLKQAQAFAEAIHHVHPRKLLAYNCSPSFNWRLHLDEAALEGFQRELGRMGYRFQFVTLSAFHAMNYSMFTLARDYLHSGMAAYARLQQLEFEAEKHGYEAIRHQEFVGTGYFDDVTRVATAGLASTLGMSGSTEAAQFARERE